MKKKNAHYFREIDRCQNELWKWRGSQTDEARLAYGRILKRLRWACEKAPCSFRYILRNTQFEPKQAEALISIHEARQRKTLNLRTIREVGWNKLMVIAPKLGRSFDRYWIELARSTDIRSLRMRVEQSVVVKIKSLTFHLSTDEIEELDAILVQFGAKKNLRGLDNRSSALMAMARAAARSVNQPLRVGR